jgi:hypothetical protein
MKLIIRLAALAGGVLAAVGLTAGACAPPAVALPGQCWNSPFGGFCDTDGWADGSYNHCESTGFGSSKYSNCYRACHDLATARPFMTDSDVRTPC